MQSPVLKAVVHDDEVTFQLLGSDSRGGHTFRVLHMWHVRKLLFKFECLGIAAIFAGAVTATSKAFFNLP